MDTTKRKIKNKNYKYLMPNTNSSTIQVQKRDGRLEPLDINKIHFVVEEACEGDSDWLPGYPATCDNSVPAYCEDSDDNNQSDCESNEFVLHEAVENTAIYTEEVLENCDWVDWVSDGTVNACNNSVSNRVPLYNLL